jgi:hypothetical protein
MSDRRHSVKLILAALVVSGLASSLVSQQATPAQHDAHSDDLGTNNFATSCTPAAHAEFQRGVAMLHSYWFGYAGKTFRSVLEKDPGCAIAYWGLALDLLGNTLSGPPSRPNADAAWKLLEEARGVPGKTDREAAWLEAIRAYFRNHDSVPVADRLVAYNAEMKKLASSPVSIINFTALAAMPARYALERGDWKAASALAVASTDYPQADALTRFERGLGFARSGDAQSARREIEALEALRRKLQESGSPYWADRTTEQILAVSAWAALADCSKEKAVVDMRRAADSEQASVKDAPAPSSRRDDPDSRKRYWSNSVLVISPPSQTLNVTTTDPKRISSPSTNGTAAVTSWPRTRVPFLLLRSSSVTRSRSTEMRACSRETPRESSQT